MKIALCGNEQLEMASIEEYLNLYSYQKYEFDFFGEGAKLLKYTHETDTRYGIYFIDTTMSDMDGIALAKSIRKFDLEGLIIFVSDQSYYMSEAFKVQTFDYLLKPIFKDQLIETMDRARNYLQIIHSYFEFSFNRKKVVLTMDEIIYITKSGRIAYIHTTEKVYKTYLKTSEILNKLNEEMFVQIHGSYVVNLKYIVSLMKTEVHIKEFQDGVSQDENTVLSISRKFRDNLQERYEIFLRKRN